MYVHMYTHSTLKLQCTVEQGSKTLECVRSLTTVKFNMSTHTVLRAL